MDKNFGGAGSKVFHHGEVIPDVLVLFLTSSLWPLQQTHIVGVRWQLPQTEPP